MRTAACFIAVVTMLILSFILPACEPNGSAPATLTVFAAASTTDVMSEIGRRYERETGVRVRFSFDATSNLARQIQAGAPADVFLAADERWMDELVASKSIRRETRSDLLTNDLVLIAPSERKYQIRCTTEFEIEAAITDVRRIALAEPKHVPAGRYAKQALESLGWWEAFEPRIVPALDVRAALRLVEMVEADLGIVYATDVAATAVEVVATFPEYAHDPIRYPIAACVNGSTDSDAFIRFLRSSDSVEVFRHAGFRVVQHDHGAG